MSCREDKIGETGLVSVIIPTRNAESSLPALLQQLQQQHFCGGLEIIIIDSASTDHTIAIARQFGVRVLEISVAEFDHGATRTMAAKQAAGDIVVLFTQDAVPQDEHCLDNLLRPLYENESIAVSYGRQLARPDASLFGRHLRMFNYGDTSCVRQLDDRLKLGLKTVFVSNSCAAYRKKALSLVDYFGRDHLFGEDACAVGRLLLKGYRIAYVAEARVYHSHNYSMLQEFRRYFDVGAFHRQQGWLLKEFGTIKGAGRKYIQSEFNHIVKNGKYLLLVPFILRNLMKFAGYKAGYYHHFFPKAVLPVLSMNSPWWEKRKNTGCHE